MYRLIRVFAILIFLISLESFALGLGEIESHSALNQPLNAEINVTGLGDDVELSEITVSLASKAAFEKVGLERPFYLVNLKFTLERKPDGATVIHVTTQESIKEPFVDFLVEVDWPAGHMLREYTILLDPPLFLEESPAVVDTPVSGMTQLQPQPMQATPSRGGAPVEQMQARRAASGSSARVSSVNGEISYGNVTRTDTLWSIAKQMRPDGSVTVQQVMMALLRNNPEAFYNNNVNYLKAGYVLRIPDVGQIPGISPADAENEIRRQNEAWLDTKGQRASQATLRPLGADQVATAGAAQSGVDAGPRLKLVAPGTGPDGAALEGISDGTAQGASAQAGLDVLSSKLTLALENSEVSRQENTELKKRLIALEEQIASMQRLLTLRGDTLTALQSDAGVSGGVAQTPVPDVGVAEEIQGEDTAAGQPATQQAAASIAAPVQEQEDLISSILADPILLGVAITVLLLLLTMAWIIVRRRQAAGEMDFQDYMDETDEKLEQETVTHDKQDDAKIAAAAVLTGDATAEVSGPESESASTEDDTSLDIFHAEEDEIDTLAEADVYLAYRRFDKAEELLKEAISQEPDRHDYVLKLLEVYAVAENLNDFVLQAESLYASLGTEGSETWDKVVVMGRQLAGDHPLFGGTGGVVDDQGEQEMDSPDDNDAYDFDIDKEISGLNLGADDGEAPGEPEQDGAVADTVGAFEALVEDAENADLEEAFSLLAEDEPADRQDGFGEKDDAAAGGTGDDLSVPETENAGDLDLDLNLDDIRIEPFEEDHEAMQSGSDGGDLSGQKDDESAENVRQDSDISTSEAQLAEEEEDVMLAPAADEVDVGAVIDTDDHQSDTDSKGTVTESDLESAAQGLRFEADELSANLGAEDKAQSADSGVGQDQEQEDIAPALEADIDWLANAVNEVDPNVDFEDDPNLISGEDEISTKLDLARAYIDMGDQESARSILDEVMADGSNDQKGEAEDLIRLIA